VQRAEAMQFVAAGPALYGVMVSWLYALYSFDYRWSISNTRLPDRIAFFQRHWAFFLGARIISIPSSSPRSAGSLRAWRTALIHEAIFAADLP